MTFFSSLLERSRSDRFSLALLSPPLFLSSPTKSIGGIPHLSKTNIRIRLLFFCSSVIPSFLCRLPPSRLLNRPNPRILLKFPRVHRQHMQTGSGNLWGRKSRRSSWPSGDSRTQRGGSSTRCVVCFGAICGADGWSPGQRAAGLSLHVTRMTGAGSLRALVNTFLNHAHLLMVCAKLNWLSSKEQWQQKPTTH